MFLVKVRPWLLLGVALALLTACSGRAIPPQANQPPAPGQQAKEQAPPASQGALPKSVAEVALYKGQDRQAVLEAGSRQEGTLTWYTSHNEKSGQPLVDAFTARYPWIKIQYYRGDSGEMSQRLLREYGAKRYEVDVLETTTDPLVILKENGILQAFFSSEFKAYPADSREKNNLWATVRESYVGLGFNTKLVSAREAPKSYEDLLAPNWKGKMAIAGSSTGVKWVGNILLNKGEAFLKQLAGQGIRLQNVSGRALADLVIAGEVPLSPTIFNSHVSVSSKEGAPIGWVALEPVVTNTGAVALPKNAKHPFSAMLYLDFLLSEQGQKLYIQEGYDSPREGLSQSVNYKKFYPVEAAENHEKSFKEWQRLMRQYLVSK